MGKKREFRAFAVDVAKPVLKRGDDLMWYVIQTRTGEEEELITMIKRMIPKEYYEECFSIRRERCRKIGGECEIDLYPLFPSYVFVVTEAPERMFLELKRVPKLAKLLSDQQDSFFCVEKAEEIFLRSVQDEEHVVRRSLVEVDSEGKIVRADGPVGVYFDRIVKQRLRKRYVLIEQEFLGKKREVYLGIKRKEDFV